MKQQNFFALAAFVCGLILVSFTKTAAQGTIAGFVWNDLNTNGIQDAGEPGLDSVWVLLIDANGNQVDGILTDANGNYMFSSVPVGTHILRFANPGGVWQTLLDQGNNDAVDNDADPLGFTDSFTIANGQSLDFDAGFTIVPQGCFTPVTITVSAIKCDDNGTPDPADDTFTFAITAVGGTGPWGWDMLPDLMMIPYGTSQTFGPYQIVNGAITLTINDHDNPACTATVTVNPPTPCSSLIPPDTTSLSFVCLSDINATTASGAAGTVVTFPMPAASTTCPGGTATVTQIQGPISGSVFPIGTTNVCFATSDTCGNADTCCFKITVAAPPSTTEPCDEKVSGCIKYELLGITLDANQNRKYTIRVTNNCTGKLMYTAFQLPNGVVAKKPTDNSIYTAPSGRKYEVRNPNHSPFYSIRFKPTSGGISNGESDIFEYTLPPYSSPNYIHVIVRVSPKVFYEAHLNTFDCVPSSSLTTIVEPGPITPEQLQWADKQEVGAEGRHAGVDKTLHIYPNPSAGALSVDLSSWEGQMVQVSLWNSQGNLLQHLSTESTETPFAFSVTGNTPNGLYFLELRTAAGERRVERFVLQR